ncbi:FAD-binding protein [Vibrio sp. B1-2]|uniref:FAD-binding protein n=1 Tax=Vibrio sp. B1-2 TaxID=2591465 RepID=UPI0014829E24|nr:FAD-binding protein [Vibrio sp. B1-2]NNN99256.1 FAD-binding protein [Vibrio sp. B1-2]
MSDYHTDIMIVGAGPVGLMCHYLAQRCGLNSQIIDKSNGPLVVGRADALNARTLQLLDIVDLFEPLYVQGKPCNTSSVWADGQFLSRQSHWWTALQGCFYPHFLMLGQAHIEKALDSAVKAQNAAVRRGLSVVDITVDEQGCVTELSSGERVRSRYVIGADGGRSFVRQHFSIPFEIERPEIIWAVIDGVIESDFPKVPEIIVFQAETSDVAWIPREGDLDRFYIRMDTEEFTQQEVIARINRAMSPHSLTFKQVEWFSYFSVKESVAERYDHQQRLFLAGDACHIHSVNGGQGLNTGVADAFNLIWKLNMVLRGQASPTLLDSYQAERQPVARSVIESSGALVRATKYSARGTHAEDYVQIVEQRAGNITGMGIGYGNGGLNGSRVYDFEMHSDQQSCRFYQWLDYRSFTLLLTGDADLPPEIPPFVRCLHLYDQAKPGQYWSESSFYQGQALLIRPDGYIAAFASLAHAAELLAGL